MQRRNLLIGMGSLAAGGAAVTGSGAFTQAEVNRQVTVDVEDDVQGYLSPRPADTPNGDAYARLQDESNEASAANNDVLLIQFNGIPNNLQSDETYDDHEGESDDYGGGVNKNSVYKFDDLITVINQGPQTIDVGVSGESDGARIRGLSPGNDPDPSLTEADNFGGPIVEVAPGSGNTIDPGEEVNLNFAVATNEESNSNYTGRVVIEGDANTGSTS